MRGGEEAPSLLLLHPDVLLAGGGEVVVVAAEAAASSLSPCFFCAKVSATLPFRGGAGLGAGTPVLEGAPPAGGELKCRPGMAGGEKVAAWRAGGEEVEAAVLFADAAAVAAITLSTVVEEVKVTAKAMMVDLLDVSMATPG